MSRDILLPTQQSLPPDGQSVEFLDLDWGTLTKFDTATFADGHTGVVEFIHQFFSRPTELRVDLGADPSVGMNRTRVYGVDELVSISARSGEEYSK